MAASIGLGLRLPHVHEVIRTRPDVPWFEVHICNYLGSRLNKGLLGKVREDYPLSFHSVSLNLGGTDPIDLAYITQLKHAISDFQPMLVSDHLCFTAHRNKAYHDLLPIPYTHLSLKNISERVTQIQDILGCRILLENASRYYCYPANDMSEAEFLSELCARTGCHILLDLNNAYVNQHNHGVDAVGFMQALPKTDIKEIHLAGHSQQHDRLVDTHNCAVDRAVWALYHRYCAINPDVPCLIEWDQQLPSFSRLWQEARLASIGPIGSHHYA